MVGPSPGSLLVPETRFTHLFQLSLTAAHRRCRTRKGALPKRVSKIKRSGVNVRHVVNVRYVEMLDSGMDLIEGGKHNKRTGVSQGASSGGPLFH